MTMLVMASFRSRISLRYLILNFCEVLMQTPMFFLRKNVQMGAIVFCKTLFTFSEQLSALVLLRLWLVNEVRFVAQLSFLYILTQEFFGSMSQLCVRGKKQGVFVMSYAYLQRSYPSKSKVLISCCKFCLLYTSPSPRD